MDKDKLMRKWLSDELTVEEKKEFDNLDEASFYKNIIANASDFRASNFSAAADFESFRARVISPNTNVRKLHWLAPALRIASVVAVAFGIYYFFLSSRMTEVHTLIAEKTSIDLPDASRVVLNALTAVTFNEKEWDSNREVNLEGEAFFDVAKGARFNVITSKGTVSVLGTEFNVKQRGTIFEVACFEGTVRVKSGDNSHILQAGDNFRSRDGEITLGKNSYKTPQWTDSMSYFQRVALSEVFAELERQYDVHIIIENVNTDQLFTGGFEHDNLENALLALSEPLGLEYQIIKPNTVRFSMSDQ